MVISMILVIKMASFMLNFTGSPVEQHFLVNDVDYLCKDILENGFPKFVDQILTH